MANIPVLEQLVFFSRLSGRGPEEAEKESIDALALVGLAGSEREDARVLSHGMSKRLGIAQAFLGNPEVILLDEPTAGLDPSAAAGIRDLIESLRGKATLVISSHNLEEVQKMCDNVAVLDRGKLIECARVSEITQADRIQRMTFARALDDDALAAIRAVTGVIDVVPESGTCYRVTVDTHSTGREQEDILLEVVKNLVERRILPRSIEEGVALEDKFMELTAREG